MSEPASLAERLHNFFQVELPADPDLAAQYGADPQGTLAGQFPDIPADALADAVYHVSQVTSVSYAGSAEAAPAQFDGESDVAYALRASDTAEPGGYEPSFPAEDTGFDNGFGGDLDATLTASSGAGPDAGLSYAAADPTFDAPSFESPTFDAPSFDSPSFDSPSFDSPSFEATSSDASPFGETAGLEPFDDPGLTGFAGPEPGDAGPDSADETPDWDGDLHEDPALDTGDGAAGSGLDG